MKKFKKGDKVVFVSQASYRVARFGRGAEDFYRTKIFTFVSYLESSFSSVEVKTDEGSSFFFYEPELDFYNEKEQKMSKITVQTDKRNMKMADLKEGQYAEMIYNDKMHVILRTYDSVVSITDPHHVWDIKNGNATFVSLLPPGTVIKIEVGV